MYEKAKKLLLLLGLAKETGNKWIGVFCHIPYYISNRCLLYLMNKYIMVNLVWDKDGRVVAVPHPKGKFRMYV